MTRFRIGVAIQFFWEILPYLRVTILYTLGALAIGIVFGAVLARAKLGKNRAFKGFAVGYTAVMRAVPSLVMIFLVFYGLMGVSKAILGYSIGREHVLGYTILTLGLFDIANMSEVMKSAYLAVDRGQYEAAISNGISPLKANIHIVLPQAAAIAIPSVGNNVVRLIKEGSLAYSIGLIDIMGYAYTRNQLTWSNNLSEIYIALSCIYWILSIAIDFSFRKLELLLKHEASGRRLGKGAAR